MSSIVKAVIGLLVIMAVNTLVLLGVLSLYVRLVHNNSQ
jgi:hypothetical protein